MSIKDFGEKIKLFWANIRDRLYSQERGLKIKSDLFVVILIVLVGFASFGLGKLSAYENQKTPISIYDSENMTTSFNRLQETGTSTVANQAKGIVFASKTGTKYYYPDCASGNRIAMANRVWFQSVSDAEAAGLTIASGCK